MGDLAAAADGTLAPARSAELASLAQRDPTLASALDDQRRAAMLIRGAAADVRAPLPLRERLEAEVAAARRPHARRRRFSLAAAGALATAFLLAVALVLPGGGPTVEEAAAFGAQPPAAPAPAADGKVLAASQDGIPFPDWGPDLGWEATGVRIGEIDGRSATTVTYAKDGEPVAYTIVGGEALDRPEDARIIDAGGIPVAVFRTGDGTPVATWERDGKTCVLSGDGIAPEKLAELAGTTGEGAYTGT